MIRVLSKSLLTAVMLFSLCAPVPASAEAEHDCLVRHVTDGRHLNEHRRPIYAQWAHRKGLSRIGSYSVSTILIGSELFSINDSKEIDRDAREFQDAGIPIVCSDLMPIPNSGPEPICPKGTDTCYLPVKGTTMPERPLPTIEVPASVKSKPQAEWTKKIRASYDEDLTKMGGTSFPATLETARAILHEMNEDPRFFCIGRHLVESLVRIAALAPRYEKSRVSLGLVKSPLPISRRLIESHITLLATTGAAFGLDGLDTRAAVFQSKGIPLICNDVPPIPDPDQP